MTLGAQILIVAAIRAGGWARATLYSSAHVDYWRWCRSEAELSRFLMHYIGGGTDFPFDLLASSLEECRTNQPIRVMITDTDFDANYAEHPSHAHLRRGGAVFRPGRAAPAPAASGVGRSLPHHRSQGHRGSRDGRHSQDGCGLVAEAPLSGDPPWHGVGGKQSQRSRPRNKHGLSCPSARWSPT